MPTSTALTGDIELRQRSRFSRHGLVGVGQRAHETIEDRKVKLACHDSRLIDGDSDLLLMVPALGELAGGVEPVCGFFLSSPARRELRRREWIERLVIFGAFC